MSDDWLNNNRGGSGGPGVYFGTIGHKVVGEIISTPRAVETEYGQRLAVELRATGDSTALKGTEGADGQIAEGDEVTLWIKPGAQASAIGDAVKETGAKGLAEGDTIAVAYSGDGEKKKAGWNAPKLYQARYTPAKTAVDVNSLV